MKSVLLSIILTFYCLISYGQDKPFEHLDFIIGQWAGTGTGFGNNTSAIESEFRYVRDSSFIEVRNESRFEPTDENPEGEHHIDHGFISFDKSRKLIVFRQFSIEGYVNQYILNNTLSDEVTMVFETELIENFVQGGKAR